MFEYGEKLDQASRGCVVPAMRAAPWPATSLSFRSVTSLTSRLGAVP
jgi:hypothetical protein